MIKNSLNPDQSLNASLDSVKNLPTTEPVNSCFCFQPEKKNLHINVFLRYLFHSKYTWKGIEWVPTHLLNPKFWVVSGQVFQATYPSIYQS